MTYKAYFLCDLCGHKWQTSYAKISSLELGDVCENCLKRPPYRENYRGCVSEPYFYESEKNET